MRQELFRIIFQDIKDRDVVLWINKYEGLIDSLDLDYHPQRFSPSFLRLLNNFNDNKFIKLIKKAEEDGYIWSEFTINGHYLMYKPPVSYCCSYFDPLDLEYLTFNFMTNQIGYKIPEKDNYNLGILLCKSGLKMNRNDNKSTAEYLIFSILPLTTREYDQYDKIISTFFQEKVEERKYELEQKRILMEKEEILRKKKKEEDYKIRYNKWLENGALRTPTDDDLCIGKDFIPYFPVSVMGLMDARNTPPYALTLFKYKIPPCISK